jgi:hypothetical protein
MLSSAIYGGCRGSNQPQPTSRPLQAQPYPQIWEPRRQGRRPCFPARGLHRFSGNGRSRANCRDLSAVGFISRPELARGGTEATASNINCDILHKPTAPVHAIGAISIPPLSPACTSVHGGHHHYYRQPKQELPKGAENTKRFRSRNRGPHEDPEDLAYLMRLGP